MWTSIRWLVAAAVAGVLLVACGLPVAETNTVVDAGSAVAGTGSDAGDVADAGPADAGAVHCGICFPDGGHSTPCFAENDAGATSTVPYCLGNH